MSVRISSGRFNGRVIQVPAGLGVRPTTGRVRQSVLQRIDAHLLAARFLDAFSGSGVMGFEALSRGACQVLAVEKDPRHAAAIQKNADLLKLNSSEFQLLQRGLEGVLKQPPALPFDVVYLDPPYGFEGWKAVLSALKAQQWLANEALLVLETAPNDALPPPDALGYRVLESLSYGDTAIQLWLA